MSGFEGDLVGHTLNARYRLLALLGSGSSARVYLAHDVQLARQVAVKVLHASLAEDPEFLRRFRIEAEALGQLTHPNIVTVHDFNDGANALGEPPYLVTNYLEGGSLRNLLDQGYRLTPSQAARLGLDIVRGLAFAHARGYVHRDVKPANVLFTDDQRAHIADFGLARAKAEAARTEADGAPVGTMRYLSPEQVMAEATDKSDVYSLALVLVESVTGVVPFSRDNWQGTVFARTREDLRAPEMLGGLTDVINAAGTRDLDLRLDAAGFAERIEEAARRLPRVEPLPLDGARVLQRGRLLDGRDPTRILVPASPRDRRPNAEARPDANDDVTIVLPDDGPTRSNGGLAPSLREPATVFDQAHFDDETVPPRPRRNASTADTPEIPLVIPPEHVPRTESRPRRVERAEKTGRADLQNEPSRRRRWWPRLLASLALVAVVAGSIGAVVWLRRPELHDVPLVEQMTLADARAAISNERLVVVTDPPVFSEAIAEGLVVAQEPQPPRRLKKGETITLTLSKGRAPIVVPLLDGLTVEQGVAVLQAAGLGVATPARVEASQTVSEGKIISWSPRNPQLPGTVVNLVVSSGPPTVTLPRVNGMSPAEAKAALPPKLSVSVVEVFADNTPKGQAVGTNPKSGTEVAADAPVKLLISLGPSTVVVPDVINLSPADAAVQLRAAGLKLASTMIGAPDQPVLHTRPVRRSTVKRGTVVTLYTTDEGVPLLPGEEPTTTALVSPLAAPDTTSVPSSTKAPTSSKAPTSTKKP